MAERKTKLPDARVQPRFAGIATFGRYPRIEDVPPGSQPVDWAIYGVPFDQGVTYRPGARFGPRAIRDESQYLKCYSIPHDVDVCEALSLADAGDSPVLPFDCKGTLDAVDQFASGLADPEHTRLLALGGDHSIAYANIKATWERRGKPNGGLALIHFDTHLDTWDQLWGEKWSHASPFIRCIEDGLVNPRQMISIGIKGPLNGKDDLYYAIDKGVQVVTYEEIQSDDGAERIQDFMERIASAPAYLSFDIDCVDPAFAPGTGTPCPGGFTPYEAFNLLRGLSGVNLVGADVVEVLPERDPGGYTALLAAHIAFEILCLDAVRGNSNE